VLGGQPPQRRRPPGRRCAALEARQPDPLAAAPQSLRSRGRRRRRGRSWCKAEARAAVGRAIWRSPAERPAAAAFVCSAREAGCPYRVQPAAPTGLPAPSSPLVHPPRSTRCSPAPDQGRAGSPDCIGKSAAGDSNREPWISVRSWFGVARLARVVDCP
jgi:hypothetical protein